MKKNIITLFLILLYSICHAQSVFMVTAPASGGGAGPNWRAITISAANVSGGSDLTNFPVTFQGTFSYLATVANGGKVQNGSGFDITFSTDNAGTSLLNWEVESYVPTTGAITVHIKVPTLSASTTTTIYLRYNNSSISTFQGGSAGSVWDANYKQVYHFNETLSGSSGQTIHDFTTNVINMTTHGSWTTGQQAAGQVGGAISLQKASNDYFTFTNQSYTSTYTVEGWYRSPGTPDLTDNWWLASNDETSLMGINTTYEFFNACGNAGDSGVFNANTWYHIVFTRNGTTSQCFRNGIAETVQATGCNAAFAGLGQGFSGADITQDIIADEIRVSNVVRTAGWIKTEYTNQSNPGSFYSIGAEN